MTAAKPRRTAVLAIAQNGVIGKDGGLPWRVRDDLKWFKKTTLGKPVIMGRATYESLGKPLPGRLNIVLTRKGVEAPGEVEVFASLEAALDRADAAALADGAEEVCIIGGAQLYDAAMPLLDRLYLTQVLAEVEGDTFLDLPDREAWEITERGRIDADERNEHPAIIEQWDRR